MCKQRLDAFSVMTRSLECLGLGQRPSNVTGLLVDAARHPPERCLWAALRFQQTATAVAHAGHIQKCLPIVDQPARREGLAGRADVHIALLVEREVYPAERPILTLRLIDHRDVRRNLLIVDEPVEVCPRSVGRIGRVPLGLEIEAFLGALDHGLCRPRPQPGGWRVLPRHQ